MSGYSGIGGGGGGTGPPGAPGAPGATGAAGPAGDPATNNLKVIRRVFSDAEIKALPTTGELTLVAGVANKIFLAQLVAVQFSNAVVYSNIAGAARIKVYANVGFEWFNVVASYILASGSSPALAVIRADALYGVDGSILGAAAFYGASLKMSVLNPATGNFTGGDSSNKLVVTCFYYELEREP